MVWNIQLADVVFGREEEEAVLRVLRSGWLTQGEVTAAFEKEFANLVGTAHGIAVSSGTAALTLALAALDAPPGSEVIVPSLTFVATASAAVAAGLVPVFADVVSQDDLTLNPQDVAQRLTEKTVAVIPVHYAGYAADIAGLKSVTSVAIIEDCAHAPGACGSTGDGQHGSVGGLGDVGCFSFFSNKNITVGEGGMLTTDNGDLAATLRLLRSHSMTTNTWTRHQGHVFSYDVARPGWNFRIDEMRSALGRCQLARLSELNARRVLLVHRYIQMFRKASIDGLAVPFSEQETSAPHLQVVLLPEGLDRGTVMANLRERGIQSSIHYPPAHRFQCYYRPEVSQLPVTDSVSSRLLTLPLHPNMSKTDVDQVVEVLTAAIVG